MLNGIVWNRTDYLYKNGFGVKWPTMVDMPYQPTNPISLAVQERCARHDGHCWEVNKHISNVILWTPSHGHTSVGRWAKTYTHQLCVDPGCGQKDLPRV